MSEPTDEQLEALYRGSSQDGPSAEMDRRILQAAAARAAKRPRRRYWPAAGLASAAVLVLAFSLVVQREPSVTGVATPPRSAGHPLDARKSADLDAVREQARSSMARKDFGGSQLVASPAGETRPAQAARRALGTPGSPNRAQADAAPAPAPPLAEDAAAADEPRAYTGDTRPKLVDPACAGAVTLPADAVIRILGDALEVTTDDAVTRYICGSDGRWQAQPRPRVEEPAPPSTAPSTSPSTSPSTPPSTPP